MNWIHEHWRLSLGLALGVTATGITLYRLDRWRRRLNFNLERHR